MLRKRAILAVAYLMATAIMLTSGIAYADHTFNGEHWASSTVDYYDITTNYSGNVVSRRVDFNSAVDEVTLVAGSSGADIQIADSAYGLETWVGYCMFTAGWGEAFIDLNDSFMLPWKNNSEGNKVSSILAHEFGHCVGGMDHHEATGRIMQGSVDDFYDDDGVWGIDSTTADDIDSFWGS